MKKLFVYLPTIIILLMFCSLTDIYSAPPKIINYQAKLIDAEGKVIDGVQTIHFSVYDSESGVNVLWQESQNCNAKQGFINVYLGAVTPLELDFDIPYWLELTIGSAVPYARVKLATVPYAYYALNADKAETSSTSLMAESVNDGSITLSKLAPGTNVGDIHWDGGKWIISSTSTPVPGAFVTVRSITSNSPGNFSIDDFVFGSPQLANVTIPEHMNHFFFDKSSGAFRAGRDVDTCWNDKNVGNYSFAGGLNCIASATSSVAFGNGSKASGVGAAVFGYRNIAEGENSVAMGFRANAYGDFSTATGASSRAIGVYSTAMGYSTTASGLNSTSMGYQTTGSGAYSTSMGYKTTADDTASTAMGAETKATGKASTAMGTKSFAFGNNSTAMGYGTSAIGDNSAAFGYATKAESFCQISIGRYPNSPKGDGHSWVDTDRLFVIGKGKSSLFRRDALVVLKNGNTKIYGNLDVNGTISKSGGSFKIDHPQDPFNKYLYHSFIESPDMMNIYNGNVVTDVNGNASVQLPDYFESLNIEFRYQLTVIGQFAQAIIFEKIKDNKFKIKTDKPNVEVSWMVTGIRNDSYAKDKRI
ncbi:MAG: hypothetical protein KAH48_03925, partial [Chlorobi bacterium]|nr:hypothetical protein [Chlorobiota bacterium]